MQGDGMRSIARIAGALGLVCGIIGVLAGLTDHAWKFWPEGWFAGGGLLVLLALLVLVEGATTGKKPQA
jgi:cytosine/uracil/thiamine/allantoin permease